MVKCTKIKRRAEAGNGPDAYFFGGRLEHRGKWVSGDDLGLDKKRSLQNPWHYRFPTQGLRRPGVKKPICLGLTGLLATVNQLGGGG